MPCSATQRRISCRSAGSTACASMAIRLWPGGSVFCLLCLCLSVSTSLPLCLSVSLSLCLSASLSHCVRVYQVLTGKFHQDSAASTSDANAMQQRYFSASMGEALAGLQAVCDEHSVDLKEAALRWLVYHSALDPAHGDKVRCLTTRVSTVRSETSRITSDA